MIGVSWLLAATLAVTSPPGDDDALTPGSYTVVDASGTPVATVVVRAGQGTELSLPPGSYRVLDAQGREVASTTAREGEPVRLGPTSSDELGPDELRKLDEPFPSPRLEHSAVEPESSGHDGPKLAKWKSWGSPLLSAFIPGLGHAINRQGGRALAFFATSVGLALGVTAVVLTDNPSEGTAKGDAGESGALEIARLIGFGSLTTALGMLWSGQVMDAHAVGRGRPADPKHDYAVSLTFNRFSTIGMKAGQPSYALYDDWSFGVMGQVVPRVDVGIADISLKFGDRRGAYVIQAGPRAMWRFFDRRRIWLGLGGGFIFQGASSPPSGVGLEESEEHEEVDRGFGAIPYAQIEGQWFLLDRWTLGLTPRISVPLTDRFYAQGRKIPRFSTTFELGASVGVRF